MSRVSKVNKSDNRQRNKHKLFVIQQAQKCLNKITICNIYSDNITKNSIVFEDSKPITVDKALAWNMNNIRTHWELICGVLCRNQQGKHYALYTGFRAIQECFSENISQLTIDVCEQLFDQSPNLHKLCPFWLAMPKTGDSTEINIDCLFQTIHHFEVFNKIGTNFEINVNMPFVDYHKGKTWQDLALNFTFEYWELDTSQYYLSDND